MAKVHTLLLLLLAAVAAIHCADEKPTTGSGCITNCKKKKDGSYQSCERCDLFIKCLNGYMKETNCKGNKVWDDRKKNCVSSPSATCTPIVVPTGSDKVKPTRPRFGKQPNILYILADDQGYNDMGYTNDEFHTPNLDTLAKFNGRIFDQMYFQPVCTPSRTALMTGLYPYKAGMHHFILAGFNPHCLPFDVKLLPERLKEEGYSTHLLGKWHLGFCQKGCTPPERGFDTFIGQYGGQGNQTSHESQPPDPIWYDWRNNHQLDFSAAGTHTVDVLNNNAIKLLKSMDKEQPFFMILTHTVPHHPLQVPEEYLELFPNEPDEHRRTVKAMMAHLDHRTGDLVQVLREEGFYDNTIIVYSSDNGGDIGSHHDNSPHRGGKGSLFEGGVRVPAFVHSPLLRNTEIGGEHHKGLIHVTDLFSTFVSLAGGDPGDVDGVDQSAMFMDGWGSKRTDLIYNIDLQEVSYFGNAAYRDAEYKMIWGFDGYADGYGLDAVVTQDYPPNIIELGLDPDNYDTSKEANDTRLMDLINSRKMIRGDIDAGYVRLFNLIDDPSETTNLAEVPAMAGRVTSMKQKIMAFIEEGYSDPPPESLEFWAPQAIAAREQGAWASGWCPDLKFERPKVQ